MGFNWACKGLNIQKILHELYWFPTLLNVNTCSSNKKKISDVNFNKMHVEVNEKFGTRLLRVCIIGQADEPITCFEKSFQNWHSGVKEPPTHVSYGTLESITVFTA